MISRLWTAFLLSLAFASIIAWFVALMHEKNVRPVQDLVAFFKKQSKAGRVDLGALFVAMWMFASVKLGGGGNGGGNGVGDGGTNSVQNVANVEVLPITSTKDDGDCPRGSSFAICEWQTSFCHLHGHGCF